MASDDAFVTFMFTDIEGSTRLWEEHDRGMETILSQHDEVMLDAVSESGGSVFKHTGDGLAAAFPSAIGAAQAALAAQIELARHDWGPVGTLRSRMGIHAGRAQNRDGDYFGRDVNRCARLMSAAHGGQVVMSGTAVELLAEMEHDPWDIRDLGTHRLKDLSQPEQVYQLCHPELPNSFPRLTTVDLIPRQLPDVSEFFVGRAGDIRRVSELLRNGRLVTVTGAGGVGKTQLTLATASERLRDYRDGTWFCSISDGQNTNDLAESIAATIGLQAADGHTGLDRLISGLASRLALIIIDGVERSPVAVRAVVERVLNHCPNTTILCTSRERLHAPHEQAVAVGPLAVPTRAPDSVLDARRFESVRFFETRARRAEPRFVLDDENLAAVVSICVQLDGLPLAVDLAAAQMSALDPRDLADRIGQRVGLIDDRDETLRTVIDWSYDSLDEREQALFRRLAVFPGGFTLALAERVCADATIHVDSVMPGLTYLVDKSVLSVERGRDGNRYHMLELLRTYAFSKLGDDEDLEALRDRHLEAFVEFAAQAAVGLTTPKEAEWVERVNDEFPNLQAAFARAMDSNDIDSGLELAYHVDVYGRSRFRRELDGWASELAERTTGDEPLCFASYTILSSQAIRAGEFAAGRDYGSKAVALAESAEVVNPFMAYRIAAVGLILSGDSEAASELVDRAVDRAVQVRNIAEHTHFTAMRALVSSLRGDAAAGYDTAAIALDAARDARNPSLLAWCLYVAGISCPDDEASLAFLEESIEFADMVDNRYIAGNALQVASWKRRNGSIDQVAAGFDQVIGYWYRVANWTNMATSLRMCAESLAGINDKLVAAIDGFLHYNDSSGLFTLTPDDRYSEVMNTVRARVGDAAFTASSQRGAMMDAAHMATFCRSELAALAIDVTADADAGSRVDR